ncbi:serine protease, partial [Trichodesmium erythraeum 21-75]|nr:serine protease [Trichodesmium erythraeum 21-75]
MVSCNKIPFLNKQPPQPEQPEQPTFIARKSGTPVNPFALNRLAKETVVEIVSEGYLTGGNKYLPKGSGVIIGRKDSVYYVLTADHISDIDDGLSVFIRSEKPGAAGEVLPLKFIKRYPREDLAVVAFLSFTNYKAAEVGEASQLDDNNQVYVAGWPGNDNRQGFQFTPAKVTNPQVGDNLTYQPTEPSESLYKGMSGGAVLNEAGQLVGIHVGLTKVGGDGKGVLISTFLRIAPPEVEEVLGSSTPDVLSSSSSDRARREEGIKREVIVIDELRMGLGEVVRNVMNWLGEEVKIWFMVICSPFLGFLVLLGWLAIGWQLVNVMTGMTGEAWDYCWLLVWLLCWVCWLPFWVVCFDSGFGGFLRRCANLS